MLALAVAVVGCGSSDPWPERADTYWEALTTTEKGDLCVLMRENTGLDLISLGGNDNDKLDIEGVGSFDDSFENRQAFGAQLDRLAEEHC